MRTHNVQAFLFLGTAVLVALLFVRDREVPLPGDSAREADALILRYPLRVPLQVGSQSVDSVASETRPVLLADDAVDKGQEEPSHATGPQLASDYRPLEEKWSAGPLSTINRSSREPPIRRLIPAPTWSPSPQRVREHRVVEGDTLQRIAQRYLGSTERWLELFSYNRQILASPGLLPIGTILKLPPREKSSESPPAEDDWRVELNPLH